MATISNLINIGELFAKDLEDAAKNDDMRAIAPGPILDGVQTVAGSAVDLAEFLKTFLANRGLTIVEKK